MKQIKRLLIEEFMARNTRAGDQLRRGLLGHHQREYGNPNIILRTITRKAGLGYFSQNHYARNWWYRSMITRLCAQLGATEPDFRIGQSVYYMTIIDRSQIIDPALEKADSSSRRTRKNPIFPQIRSFYQRLIRHFDCIGMIDVGLYVSCQRVFRTDRLYSYHLHLLIWNVDERELKAWVKVQRRQLRSLVSYVTPVKFKRIDPITLPRVAWYVSKMPAWQYQVYRRPTERLKQKGRIINGVNSVRLHRQLAHLTLDDLTLAAGEGKQVLNGMLRDRRRRLRAPLLEKL